MNEEIYNINQKSSTKDLIKFSLCGTTFPDKRYRIDRPRSKIACIEYVEEGSGTVYVGGEKFYPTAGDSYFLQAGKSHCYFSDAERPWKKHFINISGKLFESLVEGYGLNNVSHFEGLDISGELKRIIELARSGVDDCSGELIGIVNEIFLKMHNYIKEKSEHRGIESEMKDFLNTQITSKFQIELLCKHISKSESQTIRIFKNAYGITPYAYVLGKKIDLAQRMLTGTNLSVKQIATKLCFVDQYYFSNTFKQKTGYTPTQYRESHSGIEVEVN